MYEFGNYYAWGETYTKESYDASNCSTLGDLYTDISGEYEYDAARSEWGGDWRLPSKYEWDELVNDCFWDWSYCDGVEGYYVYGPNGNYIFLPAAWMRLGTDRGYQTEGAYWSSSSYMFDEGAYALFMSEDKIEVNWSNRRYGRTIRPVMDPLWY
jgi:hypothetical protein